MNRWWLISLVLSVIIIAAGVSGIFYIKNIVPEQLSASAVLSQPQEERNNDKQVPKKIQDIIYESQKRVVQIELANGSIGSGFLYNDQGDVITNAHVVANHEKATIITADSKKMPGNVIGVSRDIDVAVVRVSGLKGKAPLPIRTDEKTKLLDEVLALGSPLGLQNTVTRGEVSGLERNFEIAPFSYNNVYQISAPISPGNSGGPLIDAGTGKVVGINSAKMGQEAIGFSIPIDNVLSMVKQWSENPMNSLPNFPELENAKKDPVGVSDADQASYLVQYFYDSINQGDFVTAYSLLSSSWQMNTSYEEFRTGYYNTLSVQVDNLVAEPKGDKIEVTAIITAEETVSGEVEVKKYKVSYPVTYENNSLKIFNGNGQELSNNSNQ